MVLVHVHRFPNKQNHTRAIYPNDIKRPMRNPPNDINRSTRNPSKRNRRGGACVPARTSAQRRFHAKNTRIMRGDERWMRPCRATRAGTQAPPLPISIIFFHTILPNDINHPNETRKQSPYTHIGGGNTSRTPAPITQNKKVCVSL